MRHLMRHDALQEWEGQRVSRMKEYESKGTKNWLVKVNKYLLDHVIKMNSHLHGYLMENG